MTENIHTAMLQVMKQVTHVEKQTSRGVSYSFVTDAELVKALRQPMLDAGIYAHLTQIDQYDHEWTELGDK